MRTVRIRPWLPIVLAVGGTPIGCHTTDSAIDSSGAGVVNVPGSAGPSTLPCAPGRAGCPCSEEGSSAACANAVGEHGSYVTCALGRATCAGGHWGVCLGATVVTKSARVSTLGAGGLRILSTPDGCQDSCDPACLLFPSRHGDVEADGVAPGEGGPGAVTLVSPGECGGAGPTTLTGTVRDPAGNNPVSGAYVYVPADPSGRLPDFTPGASCDPCAGAGAVQAAAVVQTGPDGTFALTNVPSTDDAPGGVVPLVVQVGKWRREVMLTSVPKCQSTAVDPDSSRLPRSGSDGQRADLPFLAIATGGSDPFECLLLRMGVDPAEFQLPGSGSRHVDFYMANGLDFGGAGAPPPGGGAVAPPSSQLVGNESTLMNYDAVILPCEGREDDGHDAYADNVSAYANAGGRLFATHYGYTWLTTPTNGVANAVNPATGRANPFYGVARWSLDSFRYAAPVPATVDTQLPGGQPFARGQTFASWLQNAGASPTLGSLSVEQARRDMASVDPVASEGLHHADPPGEPLSLSFDTPVGALPQDGGSGGVCGHVDYVDFHVSSTVLVDPEANGTCRSDTDCGYTSSCSRGAQGMCTAKACASIADCADETYVCASTGPSRCVPQTCTSGAQCTSGVCQSGSCGCVSDQECMSGSCSGGACAPSADACVDDTQCGSVETCGGGRSGSCQKGCAADSDCSGELCVSGQCQGCLDDSFCPSGQCNGPGTSTCSASSTRFPLACRQSKLTPQEDALEYMLLDLTSCVSPPAVLGGASSATPVAYAPATFTEDFSCPVATRAIWRHLDWEDTVPPTASIVFSAQTADSPLDGGAPDFSTAQVVLLATSTASTTPPGDLVYIDTGVDAGTTGRFNLAMPPVVSKNNLRLTVTLNPTADGLAAPTLIDWQVWVDCVAAE